nr:MAG TPA: hypothetical protein [Caudoviricetes sp.]
MLVTDGSQGRPVQNYSAKSCKIATNAVIFINFCAYIFIKGIFDVHGVTGSSPVPRTKKSRNLKGSRTFYFCQD